MKFKSSDLLSESCPLITISLISLRVDARQSPNRFASTTNSRCGYRDSFGDLEANCRHELGALGWYTTVAEAHSKLMDREREGMSTSANTTYMLLSTERLGQQGMGEPDSPAVVQHPGPKDTGLDDCLQVMEEFELVLLFLTLLFVCALVIRFLRRCICIRFLERCFGYQSHDANPNRRAGTY